MNELIISFPHLGEYHIPIEYLLKKLINIKIMPAPFITKRTINLGEKYSPDFVCIPFKYNLGNYIEALEKGANILIQASGGCRYGYYAEVQEQILKDLGYKFTFFNIMEKGHFSIISLYKIFKKLNKKLKFYKFLYYSLITLLMINYLDKIDHYIRLNIGFETIENSFDNLKKKMVNDFIHTKSFYQLTKSYFKYKKLFHQIPIKDKTNCMKVGIIGELYTSMEPFASYFLEKELAKMNIEITRFTNITYLLITKALKRKKILKFSKKYLRYTIGADGADNVARAKYLANHGYDGLIHIKPFGCTPEITAIPIIQKVCEDMNIPIIYFSFDASTYEGGIKTRLEAFYDMLKMRKDKNYDKRLFRN